MLKITHISIIFILLIFSIAYCSNAQLLVMKSYSNFNIKEDQYDFIRKSTNTIFLGCIFANKSLFNDYDGLDLKFEDCIIDELEMDGANFKAISHKNNIIGSFSLSNDSILKEFIFINSTINKDANLNNTYFENNVYLNGSNFGSLLSFKDSKFRGNFYCRNIQLPDTLNLQDVDLTNFKGQIDLTNFKYSTKLCNVNLYGVDISKIKIRFSKFKLFFPENISFEEKAYVYQQLLNRLQSDGMYESFKLLDLEIKDLKYKSDNRYVINWIDKYWWNYGYDKILIVKNSLFIFLFFSFLNLMIYNRMLSNGYSIDRFVKLNEEINFKFRGKYFKGGSKNSFF